MTAFPSSDPHIERLLSSLEADYNPDYWADQIKPGLASELASLDDLGWDQLDSVWARRTAVWRIRIAEVLALVDHPRATALLIRMLASQEPEVGYAIPRLCLN